MKARGYIEVRKFFAPDGQGDSIVVWWSQEEHIQIVELRTPMQGSDAVLSRYHWSLPGISTTGIEAIDVMTLTTKAERSR